MTTSANNFFTPYQYPARMPQSLIHFYNSSPLGNDTKSVKSKRSTQGRTVKHEFYLATVQEK